MRAPCEKCFKDRPLRHVTGGPLPPKGMNLCRPCMVALKAAVKLRAKTEKKEAA